VDEEQKDERGETNSSWVKVVLARGAAWAVVGQWLSFFCLLIARLQYIPMQKLRPHLVLKFASLFTMRLLSPVHRDLSCDLVCSSAAGIEMTSAIRVQPQSIGENSQTIGIPPLRKWEANAATPSEHLVLG
jgi:hypothetical protein